MLALLVNIVRPVAGCMCGVTAAVRALPLRAQGKPLATVSRWS